MHKQITSQNFEVMADKYWFIAESGQPVAKCSNDSDKVVGLYEDGNEICFEVISADSSAGLHIFRYENPSWEMVDTVKLVSNGFYKVERVWKNLSGRVAQALFLFEAVTCFKPSYYLIPCVNYNGNIWGTGLEPKGLTRDGKPWVFAYDRTGLPSASFSENDEYSIGLFTSDEDECSLLSSCSLVSYGDAMAHRIFWPVREEPVAYTFRDEYGPAALNLITVPVNGQFTVNLYIAVSPVRQQKTGWMKVYDFASGIYSKNLQPAYSPEKVWDLGIRYAKDYLLQKVGNYTLFRKGILPGGKHVFSAPGMKWEYRHEIRYEIGWCGQNAAYASAMLTDYLLNGNRDSLEIGTAVLDTWQKYARKNNGLFYTLFDDIEEGNQEVLVDTCNLSWGAWQMLHAYELAKEAGIDKPDWLDMGLNLCDFFLSNKAPDGSFGKTWRLEDGTCSDAGGTIGCFILLPLIYAYQITNESKYLDCAKSAFKLYTERDLDNMECTAGALDTHCIDKETCWPLLKSALDLYEITGDTYYLDKAKLAGYYIASWMFHYDVPTISSSDFNTYGYHTYGGTSVSTQHHHLDPWGALIGLDWYRLYKHTGEEGWKIRFRATWANSLLCLSDGSLTVRGMVRPAGSQNEGFWHCNWGHAEDGSNRGRINDWLVAWPGAFRLQSLMREKDWSIFTW